ncbi:T9SS C-terminal target domain-containing protein [candidate division KSB1 bacterium]|nr:T9SS type A sorting domain-containing protein [candidate division KSB1 bacterium]RQW04213.1 MAG: T9SS C-terminal target domain-containing protein [candidate division KSB1 bacterium]
MRLLIFALILSSPLYGIDIQIDVAGERKPISPYLYGKNNSLSDDPKKPLSNAEWMRIKDSGVNLLRESSGNNSTKHNWQKNLTSAPDWYNNVYVSNWDYEAQELQKNYPRAQGMWGFPLLGKVAATNAFNFADWDYYISHNNTWAPSRQNLAGGGVPNEAGGEDALVEGNSDLYLEDFTPEQTAGILDHWFGPDGLGLDKDKIIYWCMDNEPEIWSGTHDDVQPSPTAEDFISTWVEVAKLARQKYPNIKLVGPATCNEWFWYASWGKTIPKVWLEYFIKRIAEEQQKSGVRLLDVFDIHFYPGSSKAEELVQMHRIYFDKNYVWPEANGVHLVNGGWDTSINKEYIFERCRVWLNKYFGPDHGITFGVTETGIKPDDANIAAVWYASTLGEFTRNEVELFTPWSWKKGMWEVLHLFARYHQEINVSSVSSNENTVSAYSAVNSDGDTLSTMLVNRNTKADETVQVSLQHFQIADGDYTVLMLSDLPSSETFVSHTKNALQMSTVPVRNGLFEIVLHPLSVTGVFLTGQMTSVTEHPQTPHAFELTNYPNPFNAQTTLHFTVPHDGPVAIKIFDVNGRQIASHSDMYFAAGQHKLTLDASAWSSGLHVVQLTADEMTISCKILLVK